MWCMYTCKHLCNSCTVQSHVYTVQHEAWKEHWSVGVPTLPLTVPQPSRDRNKYENKSNQTNPRCLQAAWPCARKERPQLQLQLCCAINPIRSKVVPKSHAKIMKSKKEIQFNKSPCPEPWEPRRCVAGRKKPRHCVESHKTPTWYFFPFLPLRCEGLVLAGWWRAAVSAVCPASPAGAPSTFAALSCFSLVVLTSMWFICSAEGGSPCGYRGWNL